jgi:hypothetical protein
MSLQDFLGKTDEITIIDFLAENRAWIYTQAEIAKWTKISVRSVGCKLTELIYNGIIEIKETRNDVNYYQLCKNDMTRKLIGSVFENGLIISQYNIGDDKL